MIRRSVALSSLGMPEPNLTLRPMSIDVPAGLASSVHPACRPRPEATGAPSGHDYPREDREGALRRRYEFPDFTQAWAFASRVADLAEAEDHHPDIFVTWGLVELAWVTHSEGGITDRDSAMARRSDGLL